MDGLVWMDEEGRLDILGKERWGYRNYVVIFVPSSLYPTVIVSAAGVFFNDLPAWCL